MLCLFFFNDTSTTEIYSYGHTLSLNDALPSSDAEDGRAALASGRRRGRLQRLHYVPPDSPSPRPAARSASQRSCAATRSGVCLASQRSNSASRSRSEEHTSELQSLMRISYAVFCLKKKNKQNTQFYQPLSYQSQFSFCMNQEQYY